MEFAREPCTLVPGHRPLATMNAQKMPNTGPSTRPTKHYPQITHLWLSLLWQPLLAPWTHVEVRTMVLHIPRVTGPKPQSIGEQSGEMAKWHCVLYLKHTQPKAINLSGLSFKVTVSYCCCNNWNKNNTHYLTVRSLSWVSLCHNQSAGRTVFSSRWSRAYFLYFQVSRATCISWLVLPSSIFKVSNGQFSLSYTASLWSQLLFCLLVQLLKTLVLILGPHGWSRITSLL